MRPSVRQLLLGLLIAVLVTCGVVVAGTLTADDQTEPPKGGQLRPTDLDDIDVRELPVQRASFCSAVDPDHVASALAADPESERSWGNGDRIEVSEGVRDVVHEYGCEYAAGTTTARAWVYAPPVDRRRARQLLRAFKSPDCASLVQSRYGRPSVAASCDRAGVRTSTFAGLFGEAWLTCQLETTAALDELDFAERTGRWCVGVALAASAAESAEG